MDPTVHCLSCPNEFQILLATMPIQGRLTLAFFGAVFFSFLSSLKDLPTLSLQVYPLLSVEKLYRKYPHWRKDMASSWCNVKCNKALAVSVTLGSFYNTTK